MSPLLDMREMGELQGRKAHNPCPQGADGPVDARRAGK